MIRLRSVLAAGAAAVVLSCAIGTGPAAAGNGGHAAADRALDKGMAKLVQRDDGPPGVASVIQRRGHLEFHSAGTRRAGQHRPWRRTDHMRIASVAKAFSGAVAMTLVDRGRLHLGDTIGELLPSLPAKWAPVTLREALNHTSGLPDYTHSPQFGMDLTNHPHHRYSPSEVLDYVRHKDLEFTPGSRYEYSNTDNFVVAMMARAVRHRSYRDLLRAKVFGPLGLGETSLPGGFRLPRPYAHGYRVDPPNPPEDISTKYSASGAWASGGIVSTPADLNRFVRGYVGRRLFGRSTQERQFRFVPGASDPPGPGDNFAGLGIFRYRTRCGTVYGHTGGFPGYQQFIAASPNGRRSATVSINAVVEGDAAKARRHVFVLAACAALD